MGVERVKVFGMVRIRNGVEQHYIKDGVARNAYKDNIHHAMEHYRLYPTFFALISASRNPRLNSGDFKTILFSNSRPVCPAFVISVLRTVKECEGGIKASGKRIKRFNFDRIITLSNRVYSQKVDDGERTRWATFNDINNRLYNNTLSGIDRIKILETEGILLLEDLPKEEPKPEQKDLLPHGEPKKKAPPSPVKKDRMTLPEILKEATDPKQRNFFQIDGFGQTRKKGPKKD